MKEEFCSINWVWHIKERDDVYDAPGTDEKQALISYVQETPHIADSEGSVLRVEVSQAGSISQHPSVIII